MNKNYIFVLTAIVIAIVIIGVVVSYQSPSMALDQIIKNRDCSALDKWEEEHMFDDDLNMSSEQMSAAMSLATECVGKALGNMFGNSDSLSDTTDPIEVLDEILKKKDCGALRDWYNKYYLDELLNNKQQSYADEFAIECGVKELENFLKESDLSTDTTDQMVVLGKILNKKDCDGLEVWLKDYDEYYKDLKGSIFIEVVEFESYCKFK